MCSIVLRISAGRTEIAANRDEMLDRPWDPPGHYWPELPGVVAGRDRLAQGTWLGVNPAGMVAAVLNRSGTLGPAADKRSRGELPLLALAEPGLDAARARILGLDAGRYRSFNLVLAEPGRALFFRGLERGQPEMQVLDAGTWMITSGEPNALGMPRIARHLPKFRAAPFEAWTALLADRAPPIDAALNIPPQRGFGTVCSARILLEQGEPPRWVFAAGPPDARPFRPVPLA